MAGCSYQPVGETEISDFAAPTSLTHSAYFHQKVTWGSCGTDDQCAKISVPLDWTGQKKGTIELALLRHQATGTRLGAIVVDPGGPGGSGVDLVGGDLERAVTPEVAEHYDVIGFDPRGVGSSTAVECGGAKALDGLLYSPLPGAVGSYEWVTADIERSQKFARACRKGSGDLLDYIDTVPAAQDLEVVRVALDEKKLNYLGYSYGTYLGTVYAGLHPTRVGRFVFDAADDPWYNDGEIGQNGKSTGEAGGVPDFSNINEGVVDQARGFDGALHDFVAACLAGDPAATAGQPCPFEGSADVADATITAELAAASAKPLSGTDGRKLDGAGLATAITAALYDTKDWPELALMFRQVAAGNADQAFRLADGYNGRNGDGTYSSNLFEANLAIECLESGSVYDVSVDDGQLSELKHDAPILGPYFGYADLQCAGWGGPAAWPEPIRASGSGPILVVSTTQDPATPYNDGVALAHQLADGHLVSFHGDGHTAYDTGHGCVDGVVDAYLLHGTVPSADPQCQ